MPKVGNWLEKPWSSRLSALFRVSECQIFLESCFLDMLNRLNSLLALPTKYRVNLASSLYEGKT
jgi:hypothetical protein